MKARDREVSFIMANQWIVPFAPRLVSDTHDQTQGRRLAGTGHSLTSSTTTMASTLARIHWVPKTPNHSVVLSYSCRRRAMMSAWSSRRATATQAVPNPQPLLHDTPPIVIPTSNASLSPDAASPQTAARPPPAPKMSRPKPTLRAQKAALTLVSSIHAPCPTPLPSCF